MISPRLQFLGKLVVFCHQHVLIGVRNTHRDNVDPEYLAAPTTWNARSIARFMIFLGPTSSVFDICTFLINWWVSRSSLSLKQIMTRRLRDRYRFGIRDQHSPWFRLRRLIGFWRVQ
jgi:magnesium-transporting ATPase (P-type)